MMIMGRSLGHDVNKLGLSADGLHIRGYNFLSSSLPVGVGAESLLGVTQIHILAIAAHFYVEIFGIIRVQFEDDTGGKTRLQLAVECLRATLPIDFLYAEC
jgi:hypothetical protein